MFSPLQLRILFHFLFLIMSYALHLFSSCIILSDSMLYFYWVYAFYSECYLFNIYSSIHNGNYNNWPYHASLLSQHIFHKTIYYTTMVYCFFSNFLGFTLFFLLRYLYIYIFLQYLRILFGIFFISYIFYQSYNYNYWLSQACSLSRCLTGRDIQARPERKLSWTVPL